MADSTIDGLTAMTTPIDADELAIWNSTTSATKKITRANFVSNVNYTYTKIVAPSSTNKYADYYTDGTADESQINTAITAVNAAGGGIVFLKSGTYTCDANINMKSNVQLVGEGYGTLINFANSRYLDVQDATNFKILNFRIDDTAKTSGSSNEYCIRLVGCQLFEIAQMYINAYAFGMFVITETTGGVICQKGWIHHNYMQGTRRQDVLGGGKLDDTAVAMREILVSNNHIRKDGASVAGNNYNAVDFTGFSDSKWENNIVEGNLNLGYERDPNKRNIITGNIVKPAYNNSTVRTTILLEDDTNTTAVGGQTIISNNIVDGSIWLHGQSAQPLINCQVVGNQTINGTARTDAQVLNVTQNGILVEYADQCLIANNYCYGAGVTPAGIECANSDNTHVIGNYVNGHGTGLADSGTVTANNWSNNYTYNVTTPTSFDVGSTSNNNVDA